MSAAERAWERLQTMALDATRAERAGLPHELVSAARAHASGRRLLARRLAAGPAPELFGRYARRLPTALAGHAWLWLGARQLQSVALDLGALAFAPAIRQQVSRAAVMRLRGVLGSARYHAALVAGHVSAIPLQVIQATLDRCRDEEAAMDAAITGRGWCEWLHFVRDGHPVLAERLLLAMPAPASGLVAGWLPSAAIATHLAGLSPAADGGGPA